jgi:hypothetical protein
MPLEIDTREDLIFYLTEAAELEHMLCCSYLYAAMTLKNDAAEGVSPAQLRAIKGWRRVILDIAIQEMGHLSAVSNLLTAVGGAPHFQRPNFPQHGKYYPGHIELTLAPFGEETIAHFIEIEQPDAANPSEDHTQERREARAGPDAEVVPEPQSYASVSALYEGIETGLSYLVERHGEAGLFIGPPRVQTTTRHLPFPGFEPILDLNSALAAIAQIVTEGEGARGNRAQAHYGRFQMIQHELLGLRDEDPSFEPARPALTNPGTRRPSDATGVAIVTEAQTVEVMDLFNASYGLMVQMLARFFLRGEERDAELETLLNVAIELR